MQFEIARRPSPSTVAGGQKGVQLHPSLVGRQVSLLTNYYRFEFANKEKKVVHKYHVKFTPEVSDNSHKMKCKLVNAIREQIQSKIGFCVYLGGNIDSLGQKLDIPQMESTFEENKYNLDVSWV